MCWIYLSNHGFISHIDIYLEYNAEWDEQQTGIKVRMLGARLQNITQLICIRGEKCQVHHSLSQGLLVLICIHIGYGCLHAVDRHETGSIVSRKGETGSSSSVGNVYIHIAAVASIASNSWKKTVIHAGIIIVIFNKGTIVVVIIIGFGNYKWNKLLKSLKIDYQLLKLLTPLIVVYANCLKSAVLSSISHKHN